MTLLTARKVTFYLRDENGHRFERAKPDQFWCPICRLPVRLYGLKDSTRYAEDPEVEDVPGS